MRLEFSITPLDIQNLQSFVKTNERRAFVIQRKKMNVAMGVINHSKEDIWRKMMMCQLTSQQRSGPTSQVSKFLNEKPFRLSLKACEKSRSVEKLIQKELSGYRGIRFAPKIAKHMDANLSLLENGKWRVVEEYLRGLTEQHKQNPKLDHYQLEREASQYMKNTFYGFGPKQSRNFWQALGLTRYEFVLDSRVLKWLRQMEFPLPLSSMALGEEDYYCFVSDILRNWCNQANVLPCVLDACIFSSFDAEDWREDSVVYSG